MCESGPYQATTGSGQPSCRKGSTQNMGSAEYFTHHSEAAPSNIAFNPTSRRTWPAAEAARSNSTGAASWRLQFAPAESFVSRGKRHAAPWPRA